ncbi:nose resistant to fluoxetine protein 6-like isoform X1 [Daphnia carinata]|uniref:nose resistant to fluoxetine protein 6-like isoform X1 n=1 Tax=Daphnia carinata TaxID=120202 RepID=UPI00257FE272|nr:nose resistant to fluoxetine protein 6-like isoform X1 [Daphnia carinata]
MMTCVGFRWLAYLILIINLFQLPSANSLIYENLNRENDEMYWIDSSVPTRSTTANISENCLQHTQEYLVALRSRQSWAVKMYESSGRLVEHLLYIAGSENVHIESGLFDDCISVRSDPIAFHGQYCTVFFGLKPVTNDQSVDDHETTSSDDYWTSQENVYDSAKPAVGFCLPSSCTAKDLRSAISQRVGYRVTKGANFSITVLASENNCYTQEKINSTTFDTFTRIVLSVFCLLAFIVLSATVHDAWTENEVSNDSPKSFALQLLRCFSAQRNCRSLLSTSEDAKSSLSCLHGIRVLSSFWLVLLHFCGMGTVARQIYNRPMALKSVFRWEAQFIAHATFVVDTFFLISGLLVAFGQMRYLDQNNGFFNIKRFYIRRYLRLTPAYAFVLMFIITVLPHLGTGPDWNFVQRFSQSVRGNWHSHLLYINNYVFPTRFTSPDYGFGEAWYVACDMQMFWLSPLFIYPIWRWQKAGIIWTTISLLTLFGISLNAFISYDLPATIQLSRKSELVKLDAFANKHYLDTFARMPPYIIGILLGWLLHKTKNKKIHINKCLVTGCWILAILFGLLVIYAMFPYVDENAVPVINPFVRFSYGVLHHSVWVIAVGWVVFACTHGYGGFIDLFLSWKVFLPFSRLSYGVYLTNLSFILSYGANTRKPLYVSDMYVVTTFLGILLSAIAISSFLFIFVDMPFQNLDKLLFSENSKAPKTKQT